MDRSHITEPSLSPHCHHTIITLYQNRHRRRQHHHHHHQQQQQQHQQHHQVPDSCQLAVMAN